MLVELISGNHRSKIGSVDFAANARRTVNGVDGGFIEASKPYVANENKLPKAPLDTGLLGSTRVNTPSGSVAIEQLQIGQALLTSNGELAKVSHIIPAERPKSALRIRAPYFGANQDLIIGQNQYLEIRSELAEYMFDEPSVFVPAWAFKDNSKVLFQELSKSDMMYQIQVEQSATFGMGNCYVAPLLCDPKLDGKRCLTEAEARAFATERKIGQYN